MNNIRYVKLIRSAKEAAKSKRKKTSVVRKRVKTGLPTYAATRGLVDGKETQTPIVPRKPTASRKKRRCGMCGG